MTRVATQGDVDVLAAIHASAFMTTEAWGRDVFSLQLALPNVLGLLHQDCGLILVRAAAGEAEVLTLAVAAPSRRRGVATGLLRQATSRLAAAGAAVVFLEVSVNNTAALALYTRFGFMQAGRRPQYYLDLSDALVLRLELDSAA